MLFTRKETGAEAWLQQVEGMDVKLSVNDPKIIEKIEMLGLGEPDLKILVWLKPYISEAIDSITASYYEAICAVPQLGEMIDHYSSVEKLRKTLATHLLDMFSGVLDEAYLERRYRVGNMHYHIGLTPPYYMGSFQKIQSMIVDIIFRAVKGRNEVQQCLNALDRMLSFEEQVVLESYVTAYDRSLNQKFKEGRNDLRTSIGAVGTEINDITASTNHSVDQLLDHLNEFKRVNALSDSVRDEVLAKTLAGIDRLGMQKLKATEASQSIAETAKMIDGMKEITQKMGQVTELVRDVAGQTNILAINSSIEAARAGEYGKGFSVISQEIGKLAETTNTAMSDISTLLDSSTEIVGLVNESLQKTMQVIDEGARESALTEQHFKAIDESVNKTKSAYVKLNDHLAGIEDIVGKLDKRTDHLAHSVNELMTNL
ncbi:MAG: globin-coupled sensor protein [Sporolactobacillus sp.]